MLHQSCLNFALCENSYHYRFVLSFDSFQSYWHTVASYQHDYYFLTDLDQLYYNDTLNARATNLIADETVQADTNMQPIFVEAPKKQKEFILNFFAAATMSGILVRAFSKL